MVEIIIASSAPKGKRRAPIVSSQQPVCGVCAVQISRYTCPHCNLHYCSLTCFRAPKHAACSESFDRKSLLDDINSSRDKTGEEKQAMLDMLKKFEEDNLRLEEDGDEFEESDDEDRHALEQRLMGMDLDSLSPEELLELLSPAQRAAFDTTIQDQGRVSNLVEQEFRVDLPWWDASRRTGEEATSIQQRKLVDPQLLPPLKPTPAGKAATNPKLIYNVVAVLFAYAYTLRTLSLTSLSSLTPTSQEVEAATSMLAQLLPFLIEKSQVLLDNIGESVEYVVSREEQGTISPQFLAMLLDDVGILFDPQPISPIASTSAADLLLAHPAAQLLAALSDLHHFYSLPPAPPPQAPSTTAPRKSAPPKAKVAVAQKLLFFISMISSPISAIGTDLLRTISKRMDGEAEKRVIESIEAEEGIRAREEELAKVRKVESVEVVPEVTEELIKHNSIVELD